PVAEFSVYALCFAERPFEFEAEALGYRAASDILGVAADLDAVKLHCIKQIIDEHPRCSGYDAAAFVAFIDPIADGGAAVCSVEGVKPDGPDNAASEDDQRLKAAVADELLERAADPLAGVLFRVIVSGPGHPRFKVFEVCPHDGGDLFGLSDLG